MGRALGWGGFGHRTVAAIAMQLVPPAKIQAMNTLLAQFEMDRNFIDAASYPDEWIRDHDPKCQFSTWHYADLPDEGSEFVCKECLFKALSANLAPRRPLARRQQAERVAVR
jgi:nuclease S1